MKRATFKPSYKVYTFDEPVVFCEYPINNAVNRCGAYAVASIRLESLKVLAVCEKHFKKYIEKYLSNELSVLKTIRKKPDLNKEFKYYGFPDENGRYCNLNIKDLSAQIAFEDISKYCIPCEKAGRLCHKRKLVVNIYEGLT